MGPGLMTAIEPTAAQPHGQAQLPWDLCQVAPPAISPCSRTAAHSAPRSLGDAEELSPPLSGLHKSTASSYALLPLPAQTPTLTFANHSLEPKWSTRVVVCSQPALQSSKLHRKLVRSLPAREHCRSCTVIGKPQPVLGQVHFSESSGEATMLFPQSSRSASRAQELLGAPATLAQQSKMLDWHFCLHSIADSAQPQPERLGQSLVKTGEGCYVQGSYTFPLQK